MCGISGTLGDFDPALVERMSKIQAHRGPDGHGVWRDRSAGIALGHRRLAILDLSERGAQPMLDPQERVVITYNGEIFNTPELRRELVDDGVVLRSQTDTELLLHLYLREGPDFLQRLNGMFALGLWDRRDGSLLLARDGMGVKPLYLTRTAQGWLFASELKALLQCPQVDRTLDPHAALAHLSFTWCPAPRTALSSVQKLRPGEALILRDGQIARRWRHYRIPYRAASQRLVLSDDEAARRVRDAVERAVHRQMLADVPVGAFLSGGLDSSAICAFAARQMGDRRLQCFTIKTTGDSEAEGITEDLPFARKVSAHLGVDLHIVETSLALTAHLDRALWHLDEPQGDPAVINTLLISELARERGLPVLLSGAGGDDLFGGYRRHLAQKGQPAWALLPDLARRALAQVGRALPAERALGRRLGRLLRDVHLPTDAWSASLFSWAAPEHLRDLAGPRLRTLADPAIARRPLLDHLDELPEGLDRLERLLALETGFFLPDHNLNYTDKLAMAASVEARVPLLDPDLVDLACSLPAHQKVRGRTTKFILKKAMEGILPDEVIYRPKTGFGAPLRQWMSRERMPPILADALSTTAVRDRGFFDPEGVQRLLAKTRAGQSDGAYVLFHAAAYELWCRRFVDPDVPEAP